jgi:hypothetical protein
MDGVKGLVGENSIVNFVLVLSAEGRLLQEHLVNQYTVGPPVDSATIFLVE